MILKGAGLAFEGGWSRVKLYFMLGLPFETEEDIRGIAELSNKIAALYYEVVPKKEKRAGTDRFQYILLYPEAVHSLSVGTDVYKGTVFG